MALFAVNKETNEVFEQTPNKSWKEKLTRWIECRRGRKCSYYQTAVPSPMPWGHVMFDRRRKGGNYIPCTRLPVPLWSDGIGCVYVGQRVGWEAFPNFPGGPCPWMYGTIVTLENGLLTIRRDDGGICSLDPYKLG
jgi:hypothetical protein